MSVTLERGLVSGLLYEKFGEVCDRNFLKRNSAKSELGKHIVGSYIYLNQMFLKKVF